MRRGPTGVGMLEAVRIECVRGGRTLFSGLNLAVRRGEAVRVAGANGAGKTSLLRILCGLLEPNAGAVRWDAADILELREEYSLRLLYIGHANAVKDDLTGAENLAITARIAGLAASDAAIRSALTSLGVASAADVPARTLSQGQRRRVALARLALSAALPLWILDEPFTALDARAVTDLQAMIEAYVAGGGMVVFSTHQEVDMPRVPVRRVELSGEGA